jgi:hypothetical protein
VLSRKYRAKFRAHCLHQPLDPKKRRHACQPAMSSDCRVAGNDCAGGETSWSSVTDPLKFWQTVTAQNMGASLRAEQHEIVPNTV